MKEFLELKKNLKKDFSKLIPIRLAVLGDTSTQLLVQALRGTGYDSGFDLQIWEADFNQIEQQIFNHSSELFSFNPEIIVIFKSAHKLLDKYNKLKPVEQDSLAANELELINRIYTNLTGNFKGIIYFNYNEIDDAVFGNYASKMQSAFLYQIRKLNFQLIEFASEKTDFFVCDISSVQNQVGKKMFFHTSLYVNTDMVLSIDVLPIVASRAIDIICAVNGKIKKCVILDLDNITWGGIIGDDGLEKIQIGNLGIGKAFSEFQCWIKKLKQRGIIVTVCSKNTESVAKEPFEKHQDMILRLQDISVFIANWENKVDNIRHIQSILNIGFDSMVFLDDSPFERNMVRENIPGICVPELPVDPADYLEYLYSLNLFETVSFSKEDSDRTKLYQIEAQRNIFQQKFTNENDFLKSLNMISRVESFNKFNIPRVAQLSQRSNQFNLRTVRYTETDIEKLSISSDVYPFTFTLADKFGDNGLICVIILQKQDDKTLFIDTWFMSCRVLKRGMENFVLNTIVKFAKDNGFSELVGEYIPTAKNEIVKDHYLNLGFEKTNEKWILDSGKYQTKPCFIEKK